MSDAKLLPHRGSAMLLGEVGAWSDEAIEVAASFSADSPFAADGRVPGYALLEVAAQAAGLLEAARRRRDGQVEPARSGYLVRARGIVVRVADVGVGQRLLARARRTGAAGPLGTFAVGVEADGVECLRGSLTTWLP